jgi:hypothetical protein
MAMEDVNFSTSTSVFFLNLPPHILSIVITPVLENKENN